MKKVLIFFLCAAVCLLGFVGYFYVSHQGVVIVKIPLSQGKNAVWTAHHWVGKRHSQAEYAALAGQMRDNQITDVYFHVGPFNEAGLIPLKRYPYAKELVSGFKSAVPGIRVQAWMGQREKKGGGPLDLSDENVRKNMVATAGRFLDMGFDGIHYNIEPVFTGDQDFIQLLSDTKAVTSQKKAILSIASQKPEFFLGMAWFCKRVHTPGSFWKGHYYVEVANHVDQIAVMMYDTALPYRWLYAWMVSRKTKQLIDLVGKRVLLYVGVPTYEEGGLNFDPEVENVGAAISGIQRALESCEERELSNFGVAIYARWTTSADEWDVYRRNWLGKRL
jgi:hypothetical protein